MQNTRGKKLHLYSMAAAAVMLAIIVFVTGCSSASKDSSSSANHSSETDRKEDSAYNSAADRAVTASAEEPLKLEQKSADSKAESPKTESGGERMSSGLSLGDESVAGNRKLIYKANLTVEVPDYGKAQSQVRDLVMLTDGYIMQFSDTNSSYEKSGTFIVKVPSGGFMSFINELQKLYGDKLQQNIQGQDVTEEYVDLTSRLKAKQVAESRLLAFMEKAAKTDDLVAFSNQLEQVQAEIEQIKGRMRYLDNNVAYSTIELRVYQKLQQLETKPEPKPDDALLSDKAWKAMSASGKFLYKLLEVIVVVVSALLPVAIVVAILSVPGIWIYRKWRSEHPKPIEEEPRRGRSGDREEADPPAQE